jgi:hypothetical protein
MRNRGQFWSHPNRQQDLNHDIPESFQPGPLCRHFRSGMKYGNPHGPTAGMAILNPIPVLHLDAFCVQPCPSVFVARAAALARFGNYSGSLGMSLGSQFPLGLGVRAVVGSTSVEDWIIVSLSITEVEPSPSSVPPSCQARFALRPMAGAQLWTPCDHFSGLDQ